MNCIFRAGEVSESMKVGILTPVYKRKGSSIEAKNYRGITITPVVSKVLENVIRRRIQPYIVKTQNNLQRGFMKNSSPLNFSDTRGIYRGGEGPSQGYIRHVSRCEIRI